MGNRREILRNVFDFSGQKLGFQLQGGETTKDV